MIKGSPTLNKNQSQKKQVKVLRQVHKISVKDGAPPTEAVVIIPVAVEDYKRPTAFIGEFVEYMRLRQTKNFRLQSLLSRIISKLIT
jgi:hypothetical protein